MNLDSAVQTFLAEGRELLERMEQARRVRRRVMAEDQDAIGLLEIREMNGADRHADHVGQRH